MFPPASDWLRARAQASPHALALMMGAERWDYAALDGLVDQMSHWLTTAVGLPTNGRVGVLLENSLEYVCLLHALVRLGQTIVPLNTRLTTAEINWQVDHAACGLVLASADGATADVRRVPVVGWQIPAPPCPAVPAPSPQAILFTSGTTGQPKGVVLSMENHFYSALASAYKLGVQADDVWLSCLPLYHVGGMAVIFRSCLYGTAVDLHPRFDLAAVNHALDTWPITLISVVPTMLHRMVQTRTQWPTSLRLILVGGAAATAELVQAANQLGPEPHHPRIATTYGMTETASQIATLLPAGAQNKPASVGRPLLFTQVRVVGQDGQPAAVGHIGEVWVAGPTVSAGYINQPQANAERFVEGWFRTGDMGYLDADGDLWIVQRRSDLIVSGGENVYPAEVEQVLRQHTAVAEACVVGVPDVEWGQRVAAMVQLVAGATLPEAELLAFVQTRLAGYKRPRLLQFVPHLPQTASGKIARRQIQEQLTAHGRTQPHPPTG